METIKCDNCGEYYSVTYKRCPFCDERPDDFYTPARRKSGGGKRLASNTKGGGYGRPRSQFMRIFALLLSLVLIIAAICIVVSIVRTLFGFGDSDSSSDSPVTTTEPADSSGSSDAEDPSDVTATDPSGSTEPSGSAEPSEPVDSTTQLPEATLATGFTLSSTDITMFAAGEKAQLTASLTPEGSSGDVTWTSSNTGVATVSTSGLVTAVANGTAKITAAMGDTSQTCIVRCNFKTSTATSGTATTTTTTKLTLSRTDFTLLSAGETFTLVASGASGSVTWSIGNSAVATIDQHGKVTAVGNGVTTVTASFSGAKATCVVRVAIS